MQRLFALCSLFLIISCGGGSGSKPDAMPPVVIPDALQASVDTAIIQPDAIQPDTVIQPADTAIRPDAVQPQIDGGAMTCKVVAPCGGDPTGVWKMTTMCYSDEMLIGAFGADEVSRCKMYFGAQSTGAFTYTFTSDGRHFSENSNKLYEIVSMTDECLKSAKYSKYSSGGNCTSSGGISTCKIGSSATSVDAGTVVDAGSSQKSSRYSFGGNTIIISNQDEFSLNSATALFGSSAPKYESLDSFGYCVQGDTLTISQIGMSQTFVRVTAASSDLPFSPQADRMKSPSAVQAPASVGSPYDEFFPCGGSLLGTWNITGITISDDIQQDIITKVRYFDPNGECAYKIDVSDSGSATFEGLNLETGKCSGIYEQPSLTVSYSSACLPKGVMCEQLTAVRQAEAVKYDAQTVVSCTSLANGDCACTQSRKYNLDSCEYLANMGMEHYYMIGAVHDTYNAFLFDSKSVDYCVNGNTLQLHIGTYGDFNIYGLTGEAVVTAVRSGEPVKPATDNPGTVLTCPAVTKCSGSLAGKWDITAACVAPDKASALKSAFTGYDTLDNLNECVDSVGAKGTGKAEFASDGTFSMSLALNITPSFKEDCLQENKLSCGTVLQKRLTFAFPGITCATGTTGTCDCTYVQRFPDIGSRTSNANSYGGIQTLTVNADGTIDWISTFNDAEVLPDFSSKLKNPVGTNFGTINVSLTDTGVYGCAKGDALTMYTGDLIKGLPLNISGQRVK